MKTRNGILILLTTFVSLTSCQDQPQLRVSRQNARVNATDDPDILALSGFSEPLEDTVAILEGDYFRIIGESQFAAADEKTRDLQIQAGARSNAAEALGIVGRSQQGVSLEGRRILVVHNMRRIDGQRQQATAFSVVNGGLYGEASEALVELRLHFNSEPSSPCSRAFRGCSILTAPDMRPSAFTNWEAGGMGFAPEVRLDAESVGIPRNQTGRSIELWNIPNPDVAKLIWPDLEFVGNRFACAEPLQEEAARECDAQTEGEGVQASAGPLLPLSKRVIMITESDFQAAFLEGAFSAFKPKPELSQQAATIATALNEGGVRGVRAELVKLDSIEADVLLVAKGALVDAETLSAARLFVVPGPIRVKTPSGFVGINPVVHGIDSSYFSMGFCGPVLFPTVELEPGSPGLPTPLSLQQSAYGTDRTAYGQPRATLRIPVMHQGRQTIHMLACSHYEPPGPPPPIVTPEFRSEVCNGLDDTGDGRVDEGSCWLNACTSCVPVANCGARRCVTAPDGCGGLLSCPCP